MPRNDTSQVGPSVGFECWRSELPVGFYPHWPFVSDGYPKDLDAGLVLASWEGPNALAERSFGAQLREWAEGPRGVRADDFLVTGYPSYEVTPTRAGRLQGMVAGALVGAFLIGCGSAGFFGTGVEGTVLLIGIGGVIGGVTGAALGS